MTKDLCRAVDYFCKAANLGHAGAQNNYGFCFQHGLGTEINFTESLTYYKKSADHNHRVGAFHYALCLHYGIGIDADLEEAEKYYELAEARHHYPIPADSFRCHRIQNKVTFSLSQFPELSGLGQEVFEYCTTVRPFRPPTMISDFLAEPNGTRLLRPLGNGGFGRVTLEKDCISDRKFAVKRFYPTDSGKTLFLREIELLVRLNHPCILRILGWSFPTSSTSGEIQMEYAENGSLETVLKRVNTARSLKFWNPNGIGIIICGIVFGMRFVHSKRFIHRDLKPSNILIDSLGHALIGDFGTSRLEVDDATLTTETGTVHYAAPEMFKEGEYTNKSDVFSFGLVLYEILVGSAVFPSSECPRPIMNRILAGDMPKIPGKCGPFMQNLITRCWSLNPGDRPSFDEILEEFWKCDFAIVPGADSNELRSYAWGINAWEEGNSLVQNGT